MDFVQNELMYVAEGNANLVVKLPQHKNILRLPKTDPNNTGETYVDIEQYRFYMLLAMHLLGPKFTYSTEIVVISPSGRDRINQFIAPFRPVERLDKEFCGQFGLLLPDATYLPGTSISNFEMRLGDTYSIEIKPKQGWMFQDDECLLDLFNLRGLTMCRYCCMQYLKMKNGKIKTLSDYCPMDLFSGDLKRVKRAIKALLHSPQNNLRIFKNGTLIYGNNLQTIPIQSVVETIGESNFYNIIFECLLSNTDTVSSDAANTITVDNKPRFTCNPESNLLSQSLLQKIKDLQLLSKKNLTNMSTQCTSKNKTYTVLKDLSLKDQNIPLKDLNIREKYMIGATFLDCSLMITFQNIKNNINEPPDGVELLKFGDTSFLAKVMVLDLDPKPDNHYHKYLKQTNEAYDATKSYIERL